MGRVNQAKYDPDTAARASARRLKWSLSHYWSVGDLAVVLGLVAVVAGLVLLVPGFVPAAVRPLVAGPGCVSWVGSLVAYVLGKAA